jgi:diguanylate cyclase (GGDEF)-like protein
MQAAEVYDQEMRQPTKFRFGWVEVAILLVALGVGDAAYGFAVGSAGAVAPLVSDIVLSLLLGASVFALGLSRARSGSGLGHRGGGTEYEAMRDPLTGLPGRALIMDRTDQMLARNRRNGTVGAVLYLDVDDFAIVNDSLGRQAGDQLLVAMAERMVGTLREADTIGRLGGDEFVVLIDGSGPMVTPELVVERLLDVVQLPFMLEPASGVGGQPEAWHIGLSIGIAVGDRSNGDELLRDADVALYEAKQGGKGRHVFFHPEMHAEIGRRVRLEADLRTALVADQFRLAYQPIYDLGGLSVIGVEALLRWQHPADGLLDPDEFLPILEDTGLIHEVGVWVLHQACQQMAAWHSHGHALVLSVNLSGRQLEDDRIVEHVGHALDSSGLDPSALRVEVSESALMRDITAAVTDTPLTRRLAAISALGVGVAVDDFGTGYCALSYLEHFPIDCIKVDRSVVASMIGSPESLALVRALVQLGRDVGLTTLAEGVETPAELALLRADQVDQAQGFLFARPLDPESFELQLLAPHRLGDHDGPSEEA